MPFGIDIIIAIVLIALACFFTVRALRKKSRGFKKVSSVVGLVFLGVVGTPAIIGAAALLGMHTSLPPGIIIVVAGMEVIANFNYIKHAAGLTVCKVIFGILGLAATAGSAALLAVFTSWPPGVIIIAAVIMTVWNFAPEGKSHVATGYSSYHNPHPSGSAEWYAYNQNIEMIDQNREMLKKMEDIKRSQDK